MTSLHIPAVVVFAVDVVIAGNGKTERDSINTVYLHISTEKKEEKKTSK